jgi:predicted nucleotidyltransferase
MNYDDIARNLIKKETREQKRIERRLKSAQEELRNLLAGFLEIDPGLRKVILFGSLARGSVKSVDFDIDLAVQCSGDKFLRLVASTLDSNFKVDVVDLDTVDDTFCYFILKEGKILYEQRK